MEDSKLHELRKDKSKYVGWAILFSVISLLMPVLMTFPFKWSLVDWGNPSSIGTTFGGIAAPFISIVAIWVTFQAFWVQYESNLYQRRTLDEQRKDILRERFENKFFNFISLLREQEKNAIIPHVGISKQAFHFMFYEYKALCYQLHIKEVFVGTEDRISIEKHFAFSLFLDGVSSSSMARLTEDNSGVDLQNLKKLNDELLAEQENALLSNKRPKYLRDYTEKGIKLYDGHRLRLVPFYRGFCMTLQYMFRNIDEGAINSKDIELYRNLLLSQLSEHEIALLKIMFIHGKNENLGFVRPEYEPRVRDFFSKDISELIQSKTMNCEHPEFVDYNS